MAVSRSYLEDAGGFQGHADELFTPSSAGEMASILERASSSRTPVTIRGSGTGLTGGCVPQGGWLISTEKLDRLEIGAGRAIAGAGVPLDRLQREAAKRRLFYPPDPTEWSASVGGTIATNASGSRSFRYGPTAGHVLRLQVALIDGQVRDFRRGEPVDFGLPVLPAPSTTKNTAGFRLAPGMDWIDLFCGSEGTLGVVTEADLRLLPAPPTLLAGVVFFAGDELLLPALDRWRETVTGARMFEYFDAGSLRMLRGRFPDVPAQAGAALLFEQELDDEETAEIEAWLDRLEAAGADLEGSWFATSDRDRERFRVFRHALPEMVNDTVRRNGFLKLGSDYAVPAARNGEMLARYRERLESTFAGRYVIFGHIGDAHLHVNILPESGEQFDLGRELMLEFARAAVRLGGTVSAEHGIGKRKADLLRIQYSAEEIEAMRAVKRRLDPHWLLGRGNLFPE